MRILHYTATYAPAWKWGGPPRSVSNLCEGLAALGHAVTVFTTNAGLESDTTLPLGTPVQRNGVTVTYFPARLSRLGITSPDLERAAQTRVGEFDLVHLCGAWQPANPAAARAARRAGVPYCVSPRGMLQRYSFTQKAWKKWVWYYLYERGLLRRAAAIHCTSELEDREMARFGLSTPRFRVPNVIPTQSWRRNLDAGQAFRAAQGVATGELLLLYAGRLHHKKGLELLPGVCAEVSRTRTARVVFVGPDEDGTRERLLAGFSAEGCAERVSFTGPVDTTHLTAAYSAADAFVFPSRDENFGNVAVEALACGCPVVLSVGVGAAADLRDLPLVRVADCAAKAWARAILELTTLPELDYLRTSVRATVEARFGSAGVAAAMAGHYERFRWKDR